MKDIDFGEIKLHLDEIRKKQNISINKLACRAEMQRSQVRSYCNNTVQRLDMAVLARLCYALECDVTDIVEYIPLYPTEDCTRYNRYMRLSSSSISIFSATLSPL